MSKLKSKEGDNNLWGYVDENDNWVIEPQFDNAWDFSEDGIGLILKNYMFGYIKPNGEYLFEPSFPDASKFFFGHAIVKVLDDPDDDEYGPGKYGVIDTEGKWVINPQIVDMDVNMIGDIDEDEIHDFVENNSTFNSYFGGNCIDYSFEDKDWVQHVEQLADDDDWDD